MLSNDRQYSRQRSERRTMRLLAVLVRVYDFAVSRFILSIVFARGSLRMSGETYGRAFFCLLEQECARACVRVCAQERATIMCEAGAWGAYEAANVSIGSSLRVLRESGCGRRADVSAGGAYWGVE